MILQPIPSEFPYFRGKFDFLFFIIVRLAFKHKEFSSSFYKVEGSCEKFKNLPRLLFRPRFVQILSNLQR
jgi:hypothetical protein